MQARRPEASSQEIQALTALARRIAPVTDDYWAEQLEIQRKAGRRWVASWKAIIPRRCANALGADLEDASDKTLPWKTAFAHA